MVPQDEEHVKEESKSIEDSTDTLNETQTQEENKEQEKVTEHPLSVGIDSFVHKMLDIQQCAQTFIPLAWKSHDKKADEINKKINSGKKIIEENEDIAGQLLGIKKIREAQRESSRLSNSDVGETLERSLYVNIFSTLDQFTGDLISILYKKKPVLFKSINREITLADALQFDSLEELRQVVLDKEIECIRRNSYAEQFKDMEKMFSISLTKFDSWPKFIENTQRRNLFTHCDGIVSEQYLKACKSVGYKHQEEVQIGDQLDIGARYFLKACERTIEVSVMLGQTLWRKLFPDELEDADNHLHTMIFDLLHMERWGAAIKLSHFALNLPQNSSDQISKIYTINYAIALRGAGNKAASIKLLNKIDWSATTYDFKLAYAVLTEAYEESKELMIKIGKSGELISELSYLDWPLFREFRCTQLFLSGYEEVYGYAYFEKAILQVEDSQKEVGDKLKSEANTTILTQEASDAGEIKD